MRLRGLLVFSFVLAGCLVGNRGIAQTNTAQNRIEPIEGYCGRVSILPNAQRGEITIVLTMNHTSNSDQIVFHIQGTTRSIPGAWTGQARVLAGGGVVAVLADDLPRGLLFKFPEIQTPPSMKQMSFDEYPVYGVARFGEKVPLTSDQVEELVNNGRIAGASSFDPNTEKFIPEANKTCQSGGAGSASCTQSSPDGGGCSVVCEIGYYSCCNSSGCTCEKEP